MVFIDVFIMFCQSYSTPLLHAIRIFINEYDDVRKNCATHSYPKRKKRNGEKITNLLKNKEDDRTEYIEIWEKHVLVEA